MMTYNFSTQFQNRLKYKTKKIKLIVHFVLFFEIFFWKAIFGEGENKLLIITESNLGKYNLTLFKLVNIVYDTNKND